MKKLTIIPFLLLVLVAMQSCRKEIKVCIGKVEQLQDSTSMVTGIGQYQIQFDISKARFTNGAIMVGDSVRVNYIGDLKEKKAKAVIVYLMPQKSNVVTAGFNPDAELETKPMTSEEKESFDKFVETAKKNRK